MLGSEYAELCKEYTDAYAKYKAASDVAKGYEAQYKKLAVPFAMAMGVSTQGTVTGPDGVKWIVKLTPKMSNASIDRQKLEALYPDAFKACDIPRREINDKGGKEMKPRENDGRTVEFKLVDRNTNIDFAEDWLNAGALQRDADGAYLVDDIDYIRDYAKDAIKGCNPDVEGKLNANLFCF